MWIVREIYPLVAGSIPTGGANTIVWTTQRHACKQASIGGANPPAGDLDIPSFAGKHVLTDRPMYVAWVVVFLCLVPLLSLVASKSLWIAMRPRVPRLQGFR